MKYTREQLEAMTTYERLFVTGLIDKFDNAIEKRDVGEIRRILESVYLGELPIAHILARVAASGDP